MEQISSNEKSPTIRGGTGKFSCSPSALKPKILPESGMQCPDSIVPLNQNELKKRDEYCEANNSGASVSQAPLKKVGLENNGITNEEVNTLGNKQTLTSVVEINYNADKENKATISRKRRREEVEEGTDDKYEKSRRGKQKNEAAVKSGGTKTRNSQSSASATEIKAIAAEQIDEKYKVGKILVGDKKSLSPKDAEEELMSLLPINVELGMLLAEGGYGKVFMMTKTDTMENLACKVSMHYGHELESKLYAQEGRMQLIFRHENLCRAYSYETGSNMVVIFMELLKGAELFNLLTHKVGIPVNKAFDYFRQILDGLEYLHSLGCAHLDVKPENIIITNEGVAKLVDFGHAVLYRYKNNYRPIIGKRGTRFYQSPETRAGSKPYDPMAADIFSLGITLLTVVTGERIWKEPNKNDPVYRAWCKGRYEKVSRFRRVPVDLLTFLQGILCHNPKRRKTFAEIRQHVWFRTGLAGGLQQEPLRCADAILNSRHMSSSQPAPTSTGSGCESPPAASVTDGGISFSQPVGRERLAANTGCHLVGERPEKVFNPRCIMRRLTRFFSRLDAASTMERLMQAISGQVHTKSTLRGAGTILIEARAQVDPFTARVVLIRFPHHCTRRARLSVGSSQAQLKQPEDNAAILVEFRRASGDEFAFLEMYNSVYRTLTRMKMVDEENPYLEFLNTPNGKSSQCPTSSQTKVADDLKEEAEKTR